MPIAESATIVEICLCASTIFAGVAGIITALIHSRCTEISCCCGLVKCTRDVPNKIDENEIVVNNTKIEDSVSSQLKS